MLGRTSTYKLPNGKPNFFSSTRKYAINDKNIQKKYDAENQNLNFFFSNPNTTVADAWTHHSSPCRVTHYLSDPNINPYIDRNTSSHQTPPIGACFTIANPENVYFLDLCRIYSMLRCPDYAERQPYSHPQDLVRFNLPRIVKQVVGMTIAIETKVKDNVDYVNTCKRIENKAQSMVSVFAHEIDNKIKEMTQAIEEKISYFLKKQPSDENSDDEIIKRFMHIKKEIYERLIKKNRASDINDLAKEILINEYIKEITYSKVHDIVLNIIVNEVTHKKLNAPNSSSKNKDHQPLALLPQIAAHKRLTQMMSGGPATGKSTVTNQIISQLKADFGFSLSDFAFISTDRFRLLLTDDPLINSCKIELGFLTQDEARLITRLAIQSIQDKIKKHGQAPHVLMEIISPLETDLNVGLLNNGEVKIALTSYPPREAVEGNFKRYQKTGERLPPVLAVLGGQKTISTKTPKIIKNYAGKNIVITMYDTYKMIHESEDQQTLIAAFHCKKNRIYIRDIHMMLDFIKKSHINPNATHPDAIYTDADKISLNSIIKNFLDDYAHQYIYFIDPSAELSNEDSLEKNAYAVFSPETGLTIIHEALLQQLKEKDSVIEELFIMLQEKNPVNDKSLTPGMI